MRIEPDDVTTALFTPRRRRTDAKQESKEIGEGTDCRAGLLRYDSRGGRDDRLAHAHAPCPSVGHLIRRTVSRPSIRVLDGSSVLEHAGGGGGLPKERALRGRRSMGVDARELQEQLTTSAFAIHDSRVRVGSQKDGRPVTHSCSMLFATPASASAQAIGRSSTRSKRIEQARGGSEAHFEASPDLAI